MPLLAAFPRGPGWYFSLLKLIPFLLVYFLWVRLCWWVDEDAPRRKMNGTAWNLAMLGGGLFGGLVLWVTPWFILSFWVLLLFALGPAFTYAFLRNQKVSADDRVLTGRHFQYMLERYLKIKIGSKPVKKVEIPVKFLGKNLNTADEDNSLVDRARKMEGYKSARSLLLDAVRQRADEVYLEPAEEDEIAVRFRVEGAVQETAPYSQSVGENVIAIYKVLAGLEPDEKRKPQDGACSAQAEGRQFDLRVRTSGSVKGEMLSLRLFDTTKQVHDLAQMGMTPKMFERVKAVLGQRRGVVLIVGPSGSGRTSMLYGCLNSIDRFQRSVVSIEEMIEQRLMNVNALELKPGQTAAEEVKNVLRQYPDVLMIGELKDKETAALVIQKHKQDLLLLSSVTSPNALSVFAKLAELGVPPADAAGALVMVLGQRLIRALCPKCKIGYKPNPELLKKANIPPVEQFCRPPEPGELDRLNPEKKKKRKDEEPTICDNCQGQGYIGRMGIFEVLIVTDRLRELIKQKAPAAALKQEAIKQGMTTLIEDLKQKLIDGKTSVEELVRIGKAESRPA